MNPVDLQNHIQRLLDDELSPEEFAALESELLENPDKIDVYRRWFEFHTDLQSYGDLASTEESLPVVPIDLVLKLQRKRVVKISLVAAAAVLIVSLVTFGVFQVSQVPPAEMARFEAAPGSSFTMSHPAGGKLRNKQSLVAGSKIMLSHGAIELELPHGVRAVVEAPAVAELRDERTLSLEQGRAYFEIGSVAGRGFTVVTPQQRVVDLGTAFGVDVRRNREEFELHVFEGRVRVDSLAGGQGELVEAPRAVLLAGSTVTGDLSGPATGFLRELSGKVETLLVEDFESGLVGGRKYAVRMDPTVISDLSGNPFPGIGDDETWNFATLSYPAAVAIPNPSFEAGTPPAEWGPADWSYTGRAAGRYDAATGRGLSCTNGSYCLWINDDQTVYQDTGVVIEEGKTYTLNVDVAKLIYFDALAVTATFRLYGSTAGFGTALGGAEGAVPMLTAGTGGVWNLDQETSFTATAAEAGQTLGIALTVTGIQAVFDNVRLEVPCHTDGDDLPDTFELAHTDPPSATALRPGDDLDHDRLTNLQEFQHGTDPRNPDTDGDGVADGVELAAGTDPTAPPIPDALEGLPDSDRDISPPHIAHLYPADGATDVMPTGRLTITFNEPIKLGTGRVFIRNVTNWDERRITVGDPRLSVDGRVLSILPPADLPEGRVQTGGIHAWESEGWVGLFNPRGDGSDYLSKEMDDSGRSFGVLGGMKGPVMASFRGLDPAGVIRRRLGPISADRRYCASMAIGVRSAAAGEDAFLGFCIRLVSGETVLAELCEGPPPGPPNSVTTVGLSWDSAILPDSVKPGDPLVLEIGPHPGRVNPAGYLDLDHVQVTVVGR